MAAPERMSSLRSLSLVNSIRWDLRILGDEGILLQAAVMYFFQMQDYLATDCMAQIQLSIVSCIGTVSLAYSGLLDFKSNR